MNIFSEIYKSRKILRKLLRRQPALQPEGTQIKDVVLYSEDKLKVVLRTKEVISSEEKEILVKTIKDCRKDGLDIDGIEINLILSPDLLFYNNLRLEKINDRILRVII